MAVYNSIYASPSDAEGTSASSGTYATARASTAATTNTATTARPGQHYSGSAYTCYQYFPVFDTTGIAFGGAIGSFSFNVVTAPTTPAGELELRAVSTTANMIAGASLASQLPLYGYWTLTGGTGRKTITLLNPSSMLVSSAFQMVFASQNQMMNVAPAGAHEDVVLNTADIAGTTSDPVLQILTNPWQFVGVSNIVEVTGTAHTLVTTGITGLQAGDLLIACISSRIASTTSVTLPAGWTLVSEAKNNNTLSTSSALPSAMMAYCVRGLTDPNLTFTHPVAPNVAIGRIVAYRGGAPSSALDAQTAFSTAITVTAVSGAGLTTTLAEDLIVAMAAGGQEANWSAFNATDPAGASAATVTTMPTTVWSERADSVTTTNNDTSLGIFDAVKLTTGATGNLTATASVSAGHAVVAGAFKIYVDVPGTNLDPLKTSSFVALSNGNRTATRLAGTPLFASTISTSSAGANYMYAEVSNNVAKYTGYAGIGVSNRPLEDSDVAGATNWLGWDSNSIGLWYQRVFLNNVDIGGLLTAPAAGDVIGICVWRGAGGGGVDPPQLWFKNVTKGEAWIPGATGFNIVSLGSGPLYLGLSLIGDPGPLEEKTFNFAGPFVLAPAEIVGATTWDGTAISTGVTHYTMPAVLGARTLTRVDAILARGRVVVADTGARVLGFVDAGLYRGYRLITDTVAFALTGVAADLIRVTVAAYTLVADTVAFALAGTATGLLSTRVLEAAQGAVTLAGNTANLLHAYTMAAAQGAITLAGSVTDFIRAYVMDAAQRTVMLTGYAVGLVTIGAKVMIASTGALLLAGQDTGLRAARRATATTSAVLLAGQAAVLQYARRFITDSGVVTLAGQAAGLLHGITRRLTAALGTLLLTRWPANLFVAQVTHYRIVAARGVLTLAFPMVDLQYGNRQPGPMNWGRPIYFLPRRW